jgi:hypothetical protein
MAWSQRGDLWYNWILELYRLRVLQVSAYHLNVKLRMSMKHLTPRLDVDIETRNSESLCLRTPYWCLWFWRWGGGAAMGARCSGEDGSILNLNVCISKHELVFVTCWILPISFIYIQTMDPELWFIPKARCKHLGPQDMFRWLMTTIIATNEFVQIYRSLSLIWLYVKRGP